MTKHSPGKIFFENLVVIEISFIIVFLLIGATLFCLAEGHSFFDSLYFTITTMATVWFWDITPHTTIGKILVMIYSLTGVPLFVSLSGIILENRFNRTVKAHVSKFYREIQEAEREIHEMEDRVTEELTDVMEETTINEDRIDITQKEVHQTEKEVEKIEKVIENELVEEKTPWWKKIVKK